jgi:hypothetical protein
MPESDWSDYLLENSGLPGPRANLELLAAVVEEAPADLLRGLADSQDEYLAACGAAGMGRLLSEGVTEAEVWLRSLAMDPRWRVREGVAIGLQRFGDSDSDGLFRLARDWVSGGPWLVKRAALAGVCEPRLLREGDAASRALHLLEVASKSLLEASPEERRTPELRVLRRALAYCWSVAIAASPNEGFRLFERWATIEDADVRWVVRENLKKKRLARADQDLWRKLEALLI